MDEPFLLLSVGQSDGKRLTPCQQNNDKPVMPQESNLSSWQF
jgi:hypothetical protein